MRAALPRPALSPDARRASAAAFAALITLASRSAAATECRPRSGLSSCIDADELWFRAGPSRFFGIPSATRLGASRQSFGFGLSYLSRPVVLHASSPDPEGRDIFVVNDALNATWLFAYGVTERLELDVALPFTLHQSGAGVEGVTSQSAPPLARTAVRDPRVGAGFSVFHRAFSARASADAKLLFDLSLPLGDSGSFAGRSSFVESPALVAELRAGRFSAAGELGLRLRPARPIAGQRIGSELVSALGVEVDILPQRWLSVGVEGWLFPSLLSQDRRLRNGTLVQDATLVSGEWLASVRSSPLPELALQLGGGTGIPLSSDRESLPSGTSRSESFSAVPTPQFRLALSVRYTSR